MKNFFRAKSLDTREWVYGSAVTCGDRAFIVPPNAAIYMHNGADYVMTGIPVDENTICRFLKRVGQVDFFENDIIFDRILRMEGVVCFDRRTARFVCKSYEGSYFIPYDLEWRGTVFDELEIGTTSEIQE